MLGPGPISGWPKSFFYDCPNKFLIFWEIYLELAMRYLTITFVFFISFNCTHYIKYIPDPENDVGEWVKNFSFQKSFHYSYELKTAWVSSSARGDCVIGLGEHIKGTWHRPESSVNFEYIGLGDIEYIRKDGKWEQAMRGEESNIFEQIKRVLEFDKFEYKEFDEGYWYRFKPNVPFLAPKRWREMQGWLKISTDNFLPEIIWAGLADSSIYYQIKIERYNSISRIRPPDREYQFFTISNAADPAVVFDSIKKRLDLLDLNYRLNIKDSILILRVPLYYRTADLESALAPGSLKVYGVTESKEDACEVVYLDEDPKRPVYLTKKLLDNSDIKDARIRFDVRTRPYIQLRLKKKVSLPTEIVFVFDHSLITKTRLDTKRKIDRIKVLIDMEYYRLEFLKAGVVRPLPHLELKPMGKGE